VKSVECLPSATPYHANHAPRNAENVAPDREVFEL
jgi:hypothetical protein